MGPKLSGRMGVWGLFSQVLGNTPMPATIHTFLVCLSVCPIKSLAFLHLVCSSSSSSSDSCYRSFFLFYFIYLFYCNFFSFSLLLFCLFITMFYLQISVHYFAFFLPLFLSFVCRVVALPLSLNSSIVFISSVLCFSVCFTCCFCLSFPLSACIFLISIYPLCISLF